MNTDQVTVVVLDDGTVEYRLNGRLHRTGGLPAVEKPDGTRIFYLHGRLTRWQPAPAAASPA